ncbi:Type II secretion system protein F [Thalassoglobus neptunius]|uniref:Type II secretion system protein F n=1 Tax=Thalassoglobus neptunius TaxID=1938619 RepID=A0A5C5WGN1_9PLAN|nr:type II secretion system F family protein [Thalassoglobus neptunius]TWT49944.1 Type II secretion system protein F [Thalassoglobus neptunius]
MLRMTQSSSTQRLRPDEIRALIREIQAMISSGVPLNLGLRNSAVGLTKQLDPVAKRLSERLENGATVSAAFEDEESIPAEFRAVVVAGLYCGESEKVLEDVSQMTSTLDQMRRTVRLGIVYPMTVVIVAVALLGILISGLLPQLLATYQDLHLEIPWWLSWSQHVQIESRYFLWAAVALLFGAIWWLAGDRSGSGARSMLLPGVRRVQRSFQISHFAHLLSLLCSHNVPLSDALKLSGDASGSPRLQSDCVQLATAVESGESVEVAIEKSAEFPDFLKWLIVTGSEDSQLPTALAEAAEFYQKRAESNARWFSKIIPVILVVAIGGGVTLVYVLSVFGPMVDLWLRLGQF